ncbi:MAG: hypothetical protein L3K00_06750 [Thermoplasmata archaeon]|nr:hypothetical protein [Thermoplasmata archaeon]
MGLLAVLLVAILLLGAPLYFGISMYRSGPPTDQYLPPVSQTLNLTPPTCPGSVGPIQTAVVANVSFSLRLVDWCSGAPAVNGTATESNGSVLRFLIPTLDSYSLAPGWVGWSSPDGRLEVNYDLSVTVQLWVERSLPVPAAEPT